MTTIPDALAIALQHHQAGRLQAAEQIYRQVLEIEPNDASAWHLLGVLRAQTGDHHLAVDHIRRALAIQPNWPEAQTNLGNALREQGKLDEAVAVLRQAVQLKPDSAWAHNHLGIALKNQGKLDEAIACCRRALALQPDYADAHANLGNALIELGLLDEAVVSCRRALDLKPALAEAHNNLGNALKYQGKLDDAAACYRRALIIKPDFFWAYNNLGAVLQSQGKLAEAVTCYRQALVHKPDHAESHGNLGMALQDEGMLEEAVACYRRALELKPNYPTVLGFLIDSLQHLCQWRDLDGLSRRLIDVVTDAADDNASPASPFHFLTLPTPTAAEQQLRCARRWVERRLKAPTMGSLANHRPAASKSKITVGYLSADFHSHATARLIVELFEKHDRGRLEVFGYSYGPDDGSALRRRVIEAFDRFVDLKETSFIESARRIAADGVDILVDLKGYTQNTRTEILALRPAPVQVSYLGYPGTMGAPFIDYILVDDFAVPGDQQAFFTERLVHLPGCYQVNDSSRVIAPLTPTRGECGLPEEGFVFCCFNDSYKITSKMFDVWMRLLKAVPGSVLWLLEGNGSAPANLCREAVVRGVGSKRLVFAPRRHLAEHLARHRLADLFLDTFPVNAHTTASDALWAGCPLLTRAGDTFISRVAGSLLRAVGLPELIAGSLDEYEAMALRLATERAYLDGLRARQAANRLSSPLFDSSQFARNVEKAYVTMWEIHASGEKPRAFAVSPA